MLHPGTRLLEIAANLPTLTNYEVIVSHCEQLFDNFYLLTPHEVLSHLEQNLSVNKTATPEVRQLVAYLPKLLLIENSLLRWHELLVTAWEDSHQETLCGEKLLEVIIALLPNNLAALQTLLEKKVNPASHFMSRGQFSAIFISFFSALEYKVKLLTEVVTLKLDVPAEQINVLIPTYDQAYQASILLDISHEYLRFLQPFIEKALKKDPSAFIVYAQQDRITKEAILTLINEESEYRELSMEKSYICKKNKNLQLLLNKFQIIDALINILSNAQAKIAERLYDFQLYYIHTESTLLKNSNYLYNSFYSGVANFFGLSHAYRKHTWHATEGRYLAQFATILRQLNAEHFSQHNNSLKF